MPRKIKHVLEGKWFHIFKDGKIHNQGKVISHLGDDQFMIQFYSWFTGDPTNQKIVKLGEMDGWTLYDTNAQMRKAYDKDDPIDD